MKLNCLFVFLLTLFYTAVSAQNVTTISGRVVNEQGEPLIGATVIVTGTTNGASTDLKGEYTLEVTESDKRLQFSHLHSNDISVEIGSRTRIDITMTDANYDLDEVVVVGYGFSKRSDLTGAVGSLSSSAIEDSGVTSFDGALAGRIAGVNITSADGAPGSSFSMRIRGTTSLNSSTEPLYVIDGFIQEGETVSWDSKEQNPLSGLNTNDIASIEILKDASATAIYGSRGANGVVLITTKSATKSQTNVTYKATYSIQNISKKLETLDTDQFVAMGQELDMYASFYDTYEDVTYNYQDLIYRTGAVLDQQVSISKGGDNSQLYASLGYLDNQGIIIESEYKRYTARLNYVSNLYKWLRFTTSNSFSRVDETGLYTSTSGSASIVMQALTAKPYMSPFEELDESDDDSVVYVESTSNPYITAHEVSDLLTSYNFGSNNSLQFTLAKGLMLKSSVGAYYNNATNKTYYPVTVTTGSTVDGKAINEFRNSLNLLTEHTLSYRKNFTPKHKFDALGGFTLQNNTTNMWRYTATNFPFDDLGSDGLALAQVIDSPTTSKYSFSLMSFLGRVNYNYDNRYMLTASMRADGSSRFADGNRWGYFPSVAFAWRVAEEKFVKNSGFDALSNLKFRASWGVTGSQSIPNYASQSIYGSSSQGYTFSDSYYSTTIPSTTIGNSEITWETTYQTNVGVDYGMFNNRLNITADYYYKKTVDMLLNTDLSMSSGASKIVRNSGSISNKGVELSVNVVALNTKDTSLSLGLNVSMNRSKVLSLGGVDRIFIDPGGKWGISNEAILEVGKPVGLWYGYQVEGVFQYNDPRLDHYSVIPAVSYTGSNGEYSLTTPYAGDYVYAENVVDGVVDDDDRRIIGSAEADFTGGFTTAFRWRSLSFNTNWSFSYGGDIFNANRSVTNQLLHNASHNQTAEVLDRWIAPEVDRDGVAVEGTGNPSNTMAKVGRVPTAAMISSWIEDGSYLRLQNVSVTYNLPTKYLAKIGMKSVALTLSAQNLLTVTGYTGYDPEVNCGLNGTRATAPGLDYSAYPRSKVYTGSISIGF
ncbi:MAG: TonB-dependent receptor [Rikenellaceae bacterium]